MLLAIAVGLALVGSTKATQETCPRGCSYETGECWLLLAEAHTQGLLSPPQTFVVGEPYPTPAAALCGALKLRQTGVCVAIGLPGLNYNVPVGRIALTKEEVSFPGTDDCENFFASR